MHACALSVWPSDLLPLLQSETRPRMLVRMRTRSDEPARPALVPVRARSLTCDMLVGALRLDQWEAPDGTNESRKQKKKTKQKEHTPP